MFGRRNRREDLYIDVIREELSTADLRGRAVLNDAIAQIELRLGRDREDRERTQSSIEAAIESSRSAVNAQAMDVARVLEQVANTCAMVVEQVETDRAERRALTEAIARLARELPTPVDSPVHTLGGTVFATPEIEVPSAPTEAENESGARETSDADVGAEDVSPVVEPWTDSSPEPADETIDLREHEDAQFESRRFPRWPMKKL